MSRGNRKKRRVHVTPVSTDGAFLRESERVADDDDDAAVEKGSKVNGSK